MKPQFRKAQTVRVPATLQDEHGLPREAVIVEALGGIVYLAWTESEPGDEVERICTDRFGEDYFARHIAEETELQRVDDAMQRHKDRE